MVYRRRHINDDQNVQLQLSPQIVWDLIIIHHTIQISYENASLLKLLTENLNCIEEQKINIVEKVAYIAYK